MERYEKTFVVRWSDCDANGHMRNTAYSEYCVDVRMAFLADHGFGYPRFAAEAIGPVLLREELDYLKEIAIGQEIRVDFSQSGLSADGSRFALRHEIRRADGKLAARVELRGGWLDLKARKLRVPPPDLLAAMRAVPAAQDFAELPGLGRAP